MHLARVRGDGRVDLLQLFTIKHSVFSQNFDLGGTDFRRGDVWGVAAEALKRDAP